MNQLLIFLFSIILIGQITQKQNPKDFIKINKVSNPKPKRLENWPKQEKSFYLGTQIGNKDGISKGLKENIKKFGLIHLLTPSGIHLSSILLFVFLFIKRRFRLFIYLPLIILFSTFTGFYSLKRILYFQLLNYFIKDSKISFVLTFLFDLVLGGYSLSPLSFAFSFLFWGVIIFHNNSKLELVLKLFFAQMIVCFFFKTEINLLALIINPLITSLFSLIFPLLTFNFWFFPEFALDRIILFFFKGIKDFLFFTGSTFSFLDFKPSLIVLFFPFIYHLRLKYLIYTSLFYVLPLNINNTKPPSKSSTISLTYKEEIISQGFLKINFYDRNCKRKFHGSYWEIFCKKKPSKLGGLSI